MASGMLQYAADSIRRRYFPNPLPASQELVCTLEGSGSCQCGLSLCKGSDPGRPELFLRGCETLLLQGKFKKGQHVCFSVFANETVQVGFHGLAFNCSSGAQICVEA